MINTTENEEFEEVKIDLRDELMERILITLYHNGMEDCGKLKPFLAKTISDYEISNRNTELQTLYDSNNQIIEEFLTIKRVRGGSLETYYNRKYTYNMFCSFINKPLPQVKTIDILAWIAFLEKTRKLSTCNSYRSSLSSLLTWMTKKKYFKDNPMEDVDTIKYDKSVEKCFNKVELEDINYYCKKPMHRAIVKLLFSSGIRCAELVELKWSDIDMETNDLLVREGKGGKSRYTRIDDVTKKCLLEYKNQMKYESEYVFPSRYRGIVGKRTTDSVWLILKNIGIDAGVNHVHPHRFRKNFCKALVDSGATLPTVQSYLGHVNLQTTQHYLQYDKDRMAIEYKKAFG